MNTKYFIHTMYLLKLNFILLSLLALYIHPTASNSKSYASELIKVMEKGQPKKLHSISFISTLS